jgi:hypothetical protein
LPGTGSSPFYLRRKGVTCLPDVVFPAAFTRAALQCGGVFLAEGPGDAEMTLLPPRALQAKAHRKRNRGMNGFELKNATQERRPAPVMDADRAMPWAMGGKSSSPCFPRFMRALKDAKLAEQEIQKAALPRMPKFQRLHAAIAMEQGGSPPGPQPARLEQGNGDDGWFRRYALQLLPACSVAALAGTAVALVGGSLMTQLAATSPAEPVTEEVTLASLADPFAFQLEVVSRVGKSVLRGAPGERHTRDRDGPVEMFPSAHGLSAERPTALLTLHVANVSEPAGSEEVTSSAAIHASDMAAEPVPERTDPAVVEGELEKLAKEHSSHISAYDHGYMLQQEGLYADALASYQVALLHEPGLAHILYNMGAVLSKLERFDEAAAVFARAAALDQSNPFAFYDWGWVLERTGKIEEAIEKYQLAVTTDAASNAGINAQKRLAFLQP